MNQSGVITGAIIAAFFVYITTRGELPAYAGLFLLAPPGSGSPATVQQASAAPVTGATAQQSTSSQAASMTAQAIVNAGFAAFGL